MLMTIASLHFTRFSVVSGSQKKKKTLDTKPGYLLKLENPTAITSFCHGEEGEKVRVSETTEENFPFELRNLWSSQIYSVCRCCCWGSEIYSFFKGFRMLFFSEGYSWVSQDGRRRCRYTCEDEFFILRRAPSFSLSFCSRIVRRQGDWISVRFISLFRLKWILSKHVKSHFFCAAALKKTQRREKWDTQNGEENGNWRVFMSHEISREWSNSWEMRESESHRKGRKKPNENTNI